MALLAPGGATALSAPDLWIASAMAVVLGAILSATASAPADTSVTVFARELRIVLRLTREPSSNLD
ncbi:hypothetical protein [Streptomyces chiangmaiensis]|uniref:Uncharacterized protein n=1 Tax=Streptomyces chiangmaiensis TaxID=766497 RepID=A0ABU7FQX6_9ACTN|nr:hypothetical protein [Streptomyces chiangmaiensis]MED7826321.1 hypothetical protein [Streptomyces chiangmaiensis]